jgi:hypothetical protein
MLGRRSPRPSFLKCVREDNLAPQVGLEPTTLRLTAECSAIELLRSVARFVLSNTKVAESAVRVKTLFIAADTISLPYRRDPQTALVQVP